MWNAREKIQELNDKNNADYDKYVKENNSIVTEYTNRKDNYNNQINIINAEKIAMRDELSKLYKFLEYIGGSLERRISIVDFKEELPASNMKDNHIEKLAMAHLAGDLDWGIPHIINSERAKDYEKKLYEKSLDYKMDLKFKKQNIKRMEDCEAIAKIYRDTLTVVRDTIRNKVLPEFEYIRAFLIADSIREKVQAGYELEDIKPCKIIEYRGTRYDRHYIFVKNTFDFLDLAKAFFSTRILTDLMQQDNVSEQEKKDFEESVYELQDKLILLEDSMGVTKDE